MCLTVSNSLEVFGFREQRESASQLDGGDFSRPPGRRLARQPVLSLRVVKVRKEKNFAVQMAARKQPR